MEHTTPWAFFVRMSQKIALLGGLKAYLQLDFISALGTIEFVDAPAGIISIAPANLPDSASIWGDKTKRRAGIRPVNGHTPVNTGRSAVRGAVDGCNVG